MAGVSPDQPADEQGITSALRQMLVEVTGRTELAGLAAGIPLFGAGAGLDSLAGTLLLRRIQRQYGVDVAAEDLNLDALESLATLTAFIASHAS
jgi:acyl carrier protein